MRNLGWTLLMFHWGIPLCFWYIYIYIYMTRIINTVGTNTFRNWTLLLYTYFPLIFPNWCGRRAESQLHIHFIIFAALLHVSTDNNIHEGHFTVHTEYLLISEFQIVIGLSSVLSLYVFCHRSNFLFLCHWKRASFSFRSPNRTVVEAHICQNLY